MNRHLHRLLWLVIVVVVVVGLMRPVAHVRGTELTGKGILNDLEPHTGCKSHHCD